MSTRTGKLTPVGQEYGLKLLVAKWRKQAIAALIADAGTARALALRECATDLERELANVTAIVRK